NAGGPPLFAEEWRRRGVGRGRPLDRPDSGARSAARAARQGTGPMRVQVHYLAQARHAAGTATEELEVAPSSPVRDLLRRLSEGRDPLRRLLLDAAGELHPAILLFHGDEQVRAGQVLHLRDGDVLTVLSPMAGGEGPHE